MSMFYSVNTILKFSVYKYEILIGTETSVVTEIVDMYEVV